MSGREIGHSSMTQHHLITREKNVCFAAGMHMPSEQQLIRKKKVYCTNIKNVAINTIAKVLMSAH